MKLEITFRNGAQVAVDVSEFSTKKSQVDGEIKQLDWTTPSGWKRKLHACDLSQILCLVAIEEDGDE